MLIKKDMKNSALIDGTAYQIQGGKTIVNGTGYDINQGRTKIDGTGYDIIFGKPCTLTLKNIPQVQMSTGYKICRITVDGVSIDTSVTTHELKVGQTVNILYDLNESETTVYEVVYNNVSNVKVVGTDYKSSGYTSGYVINTNGGWVTKTYSFVLTSDTTIEFKSLASSNVYCATYVFFITDSIPGKYILTITGTPNGGYVAFQFGWDSSPFTTFSSTTTGSWNIYPNTSIHVSTSSGNMGVTYIKYNGTIVTNSYNTGVNYSFKSIGNVTINFGLNGNTATITDTNGMS